MTGQKPDENIRKPMQWSADPQAGFTTGQAWQAPSSNFASFNVADQLTDEGSLLSHYKKWIQMRNAIGQLRTGEITMVNSSASSVFSFLRKTNNMKRKAIWWFTIWRKPVTTCQLTWEALHWQRAAMHCLMF